MAPADGLVLAADMPESSTGQPAMLVIFLSVFNAHVNRSPMAGTVSSMKYKPGKNHPAQLLAADAENEQNAIEIQNGSVCLTVTQIAGLIARRIVIWTRTGNELHRGQKIGMIRFGSRTTLKVSAGRIKWTVKAGDRVKAGKTIVGRILEP